MSKIQENLIEPTKQMKFTALFIGVNLIYISLIQLLLGDLLHIGSSYLKVCCLGFFLGFVQEILLNSLLQSKGRWCLVTVIGTLLGHFFSEQAQQLILASFDSDPTSYGLKGLIFGTVLGITQWIILRLKVKSAWLWIFVSILTSTLSWTLGGEANTQLNATQKEFLRFLLFGLILGTTQSFLLKNSLKNSGRWIFAVMIGSSIGYVLGEALFFCFLIFSLFFSFSQENTQIAPLLKGIPFGFIFGLLQWFALPETSRTFRWVFFHTFLISLIFFSSNLTPIWNWIGFGLLFGLISGVYPYLDPSHPFRTFRKKWFIATLISSIMGWFLGTLLLFQFHQDIPFLFFFFVLHFVLFGLQTFCLCSFSKKIKD